MTDEERAYNYASTQKPTKLQVGEIAKHYNNGYNQAMQNFMEKAYEWFRKTFSETDKRFNENYSEMLIECFRKAMKE